MEVEVALYIPYIRRIIGSKMKSYDNWAPTPHCTSSNTIKDITLSLRFTIYTELRDIYTFTTFPSPNLSFATFLVLSLRREWHSFFISIFQEVICHAGRVLPQWDYMFKRKNLYYKLSPCNLNPLLEDHGFRIFTCPTDLKHFIKRGRRRSKGSHVFLKWEFPPMFSRNETLNRDKETEIKLFRKIIRVSQTQFFHLITIFLNARI